MPPQRATAKQDAPRDGAIAFELLEDPVANPSLECVVALTSVFELEDHGREGRATPHQNGMVMSQWKRRPDGCGPAQPQSDQSCAAAVMLSGYAGHVAKIRLHCLRLLADHESNSAIIDAFETVRDALELHAQCQHSRKNF
eukprot:CAMPEP_0169320648 /NCGR_PEP_ID=MMETSP1017-20121227/8467_1 /TAXON_ID=342587 /ORGANISM="Karlodinium micrum, Strain CCMP2283" /LENGTH=140 /DNA_ID=CAMNT_0009415075 /DNA_START=301 /DNA_END=721 /DNA_ORIENTATION=-